MNWLGYGENALSQFARNGFETYFRKWNRQQRTELIEGLQTLPEINSGVGSIPPLEIEQLKPFISRLLQFVPEDKIPKLPDYQNFKEDGHQLILQSR